jgi:uncharacterized protein YfaS (alpha-2-macroglobulin family)
MSATIAVSASVDSALRRAFSEASVRLQSDALMSSLIAALEGLGIKVEITDGILCLSQGATQMNTSLALRNFSKRPEHAAFFVIDGAHPSQWSKERKIEYLKAHTDEQYRALIQSPVLDAGVKTMDPNMSRADYSNLTRSEKIAFLREFGSDAASRIMQKKS